MTVERLAERIRRDGYGVEQLAGPPVEVEEQRVRRIVHVPGESKEYEVGIRNALRERKPIVLEFSATWCAPCKRFRAETLTDGEVRRLLADIALLEIDTDEQPELAKAYGVHSVPAFVFASPAGIVQESFDGFLDAQAFAAKLRSLIESSGRERR